MEGGCSTYHDGHLHVHENDVVAFLLDVLEGFETVVGDCDAVVVLFQNPDGELLVDCVVFCEQDAERLRVV